MKEEVDYPKKNKKRAVRDAALYPPRIELQIAQTARTAPSKLYFSIDVLGMTRSFKLNIVIPSANASEFSQAASLLLTESNSTASKLGSSNGSSENISSSSTENVDNGSLVPQASSGYSSQDSQEGIESTSCSVTS